MALSQWSPYEVPQSLWGVIELYAPTVELEEIKYIIGEDLIQQSGELFEEIYALLDIWQSEAHAPAPVKQSQSLPESPIIRGQFIAQIQQFINNLDATKNHMLQSFINERRGVYDYATQKTRPESASTVSQDGRLTPSRQGTRSTASTDISAYRDNISAFEIDKIVHDIQGAFRDEQKLLKEDVEFLHTALQDQHTQKSDGFINREPSLNELKVFAGELEKRVMDLSQPVFASINDKKPSSPKLKALPNPPKSKEVGELQSLTLSSASSRKLSWRQKTLKKVNIATRENSGVLRDIGLRGGSPSGQGPQRERMMVPKPPPPRHAFQQTAGNTNQ